MALAAGVGWIDIKEPAAGALGAAAVEVVGDIAATVAGRRPVSATIGDTWSCPEVIAARVRGLGDCDLDYVKVGVGADAPLEATLQALDEAARYAAIIAVCAAEQASVADALVRAGASSLAGIMLDTADKSGLGLRGLLSDDALTAFVAVAHAHGLLAGLAGKLVAADIEPLLASGADYLGFRGAVCDGGARGETLAPASLAQVAAAVQHGRGSVATVSEVA